MVCIVRSWRLVLFYFVRKFGLALLTLHFLSLIGLNRIHLHPHFLLYMYKLVMPMTSFPFNYLKRVQCIYLLVTIGFRNEMIFILIRFRSIVLIPFNFYKLLNYISYTCYHFKMSIRDMICF